MATLTTLTLSEMIDEALGYLHRVQERPYEVRLDTNGLSSTSDTELTLTDPTKAVVTTVLEGQQELMLVTGKSSDATPVFTVSRGYAGTTRAVHPVGETIRIDPTWPRGNVDKYIRRAVNTVMNTYLPNITSDTYNRESDLQYLVMPEDTLDVLSVRHFNDITGRLDTLGGWRFEQDIPAGAVSTGKIVRLPWYIADSDDLIVTATAPYAWAGSGDENDTVDLPVGAEGLPTVWAAAFCASRREISKQELDTIAEWNQEDAIRQGYALRLVRDLWGEFYRMLDEARKIHYIPRQRPYVKMPKLLT
jgi:hypothetical protein